MPPHPGNRACTELEILMNTSAATLAFDDTKAEAFADRLVGALGDAAMALMLSLGHRTGLFDALATVSPTTSDALAEGTGLAKRYVREWLATMVTSGATSTAKGNLLMLNGGALWSSYSLRVSSTESLDHIGPRI